MLSLATVFWGMGFSWSKNNVDAINRAARLPANAALGAIVGLTLRFTVATVLWTLLVPAARTNWSWQTFRRGAIVGTSLAVGLILQHLSLGKADEGTAAFLTNLTVVFVPAWQLVVRGTPIRRPLVTAVAIALLGLVLLGSVGRPGPVSGAVYGVACAVAFAAEILLLDRLGHDESAARLTVMLFGCAAIGCGLLAVSLPGASDIQWQTLATRAFLADFIPGVLLTTVAAFALMAAYQPKVDPTRAAVIYLAEPLFAAAYAWWYNGRTMTSAALVGAGLILLANVVAEWKPQRV